MTLDNNRSHRFRAAAATTRLSVFAKVSGRVFSGAYVGVPWSVTPLAFLGRHTSKLELKVCAPSPYAVRIASGPLSVERIAATPHKTSTPKSPRERHTPYVNPSGPGADASFAHSCEQVR